MVVIDLINYRAICITSNQCASVVRCKKNIKVSSNILIGRDNTNYVLICSPSIPMFSNKRNFSNCSTASYKGHIFLQLQLFCNTVTMVNIG